MGSFACALAFHTAASRYLYAIGRELPTTAEQPGPDPRHARHARTSRRWSRAASPLVLTLCFYFLGTDGKDTLTGAYIYQYGLLAILGTMAILIVQAICSFAVIWYFHVKKEHPGNGITTGLIPFLGGIGMLFVVYLLSTTWSSPAASRQSRRSSRRSRGSSSRTFVIGLVGILILRSSNPELYKRIGRTVMEEAQERDHAAGLEPHVPSPRMTCD